MIKIEIEIDPEKARRECKYTPESMMNCLDSTFAKGNFPILEADAFRRVYRDSGNVSEDFGVMTGLVFKFAECDWFAKSAKKIIWYDNDDSNDPNVWNIEDCLKVLREKRIGYYA
ncbi:MAG: hypothetical protein ACI4RH_02240 [Huintestinicola sp.]